MRHQILYLTLNTFDVRRSNTCRDQPIHLIDAYNSSIRATYSPINALDEMESPTVVTFTPDGSRIFASGFRTDRTIHKFDTNIPGKESDILKLGKTRRSKDGQKGIVSALSFPEGNSAFAGINVFAVGTYSPGSIYVYDDRLSNDSPAGTVLNGGVSVVGHGRSFGRKKRRFVEILDQDTSSSDEKEQQDIFAAAKVSWYQARARSGRDWRRHCRQSFASGGPKLVCCTVACLGYIIADAKNSNTREQA